MENNNQIQQARDVLAKWRAQNPLAAWEVRPWIAGFDFAASDAPVIDLGGTRHEHTARLIVGTAGNPDLLHAIDAMLSDRFLRHASVQSQFRQHAERIAAAIIVADERMTS